MFEDAFEFNLELRARGGPLTHPSTVSPSEQLGPGEAAFWPFGQLPYTTLFRSEANRDLWCKFYSRFDLGQHKTTMALDFGNVISPRNDEELGDFFRAMGRDNSYNWGIVSYVSKGRYSRCFETKEAVNFAAWAPFIVLVTERDSIGTVVVEYPVRVNVAKGFENVSTQHVIVVHGNKYDAFCLLGRPVLLFDDRDDCCWMARDCGGDAKYVLKNKNHFWTHPHRGIVLAEQFHLWPDVMRAFTKAHGRVHGSEGGHGFRDNVVENRVESTTAQVLANDSSSTESPWSGYTRVTPLSSYISTSSTSPMPPQASRISKRPPPPPPPRDPVERPSIPPKPKWTPPLPPWVEQKQRDARAKARDLARTVSVSSEEEEGPPLCRCWSEKKVVFECPNPVCDQWRCGDCFDMHISACLIFNPPPVDPPT